jgi:L-methionine (R)-S-oxide reductase
LENQLKKGNFAKNSAHDMAEDLILTQGNKNEKYLGLMPQIQALMEGEKDAVANMGNCCAALRETFGWLWVGFYLVKQDELVLGPFQGPVACTRIAFGRGVCGTAWKEKRTLLVPDVEDFPGHIACSSRSKSEVVVPVFKNGEVIAVLDVDSETLNAFDAMDVTFLTQLCTWISDCL